MTTSLLLRFAALSLFLPALVACASVQRGDDGRVHVLEPDFLAKVPTTDTYGGAVDALVADADKIAELRERFEAALPPATRARLVHDPRLDHLARVQAVAYLEVSQRLSKDLQTRLAWRLGLTAPVAGSRSQWASGSARLSVADDFVVEMRDKLPPTGRFRYGLARALGGKRIAVSMVWMRDVVALEPLPKTAAPSTTVTLRGRFTDTVKEPVLRFLENDVVRELRIPVGADQSFAVDVPLGAEPGARFIDLNTSVVDEEGNSQRSHLWLPLFVGSAEPPVPPVEAVGATLPTLEGVEAMLVDVKSPLVERDPVLDAEALQIATAPELSETTTPSVCRKKGWWWRRFSYDTLEEMRWVVERLPSVVYQLREDKREKAGAAVVPVDKGTRVVLIECAPTPPATSDTPAMDPPAGTTPGS